jgi:hypothetical protein
MRKYGKITYSFQMVTFLKTLILAIMLAFPNSSKAQQGPTSSKCNAFANSKVVAQYNCLAGMDVSNKVNFRAPRKINNTLDSGMIPIMIC